MPQSYRDYTGPLHRNGKDAANWQPLFDHLRDATEFRLSFLRSEFNSLDTWRQKAKAFVVKHIFWDPGPLMLHPRLVDRYSAEDFPVEVVRFSTHPAIEVPAIVTKPAESGGPWPAVVLLHDMGGLQLYGKEKVAPGRKEHALLRQHRQRYYSGRILAIELARRGYLTIAIDAAMFGERGYLEGIEMDRFRRMLPDLTDEQWHHYNEQMRYGREVIDRHLRVLGRTLAGLVIWDDIRTVDYLTSRSDVDPTRIGCMGLSFGAYRTNYLAALDERIAAAVSVCWTSTLGRMIGYNVMGAMGGFSLIPGLFQQMDLPDLQAMTAPRALMVVSGWQDGLVPPVGITEAHRKIEACYEKAGCPEKFCSACYDAPHEFNTQMQEDAFDWLDRWLKG